MLYLHPYHLVRAIPVQRLNGRLAWAEESDIATAPGFRLKYNKRGSIDRAYQLEPMPSAYHSDAGAYIDQILDNGVHVHALSGVTGSGYRAMERML